MIKETCELTENEIRKNFQAQFDVHQNDFDNDLENLFKCMNTSVRIRERCRQFLKRQTTEICNVWCTAAIQAHDQKQTERLVRDGSADLRHLIEDIIKSGKTMTKEKAKQEFDSMWNKKIQSIKNNIKPEERLKEAIKFVYANYNIFEKESLPSHEVILSHLEFIHELSKKQYLKDVIVLIQNFFVDNVSKLPDSALERSRQKSDATVVYTCSTLHNFKYLYKETLTNYYTAGTMDLQTPRKTSTNPIPLRFDFIKNIRDTILIQMTSDPKSKSNILNIPELFHKIMNGTIAIVDGNNRIRRPIEIDLIQKIVGFINTYINEINLELVVFKFIIELLYYYVVPDAECDKEGAENFTDKIRSTIQCSLMRDGQKIITRIVETQKNLNRKHIQTICDGKLLAVASDDKWLLRYIVAPNDIIEEEFKILWTAVEARVNQQLSNEKNQWRNILVEFFNCIEFMKSSLAHEGSSVQYIDDMFEASGGAAVDNLKNKGQCMVLLLFTYLSGSKIKEGTSYTVFDKTYTLKPKGLKLFEKLPEQSLQLANLIKEMSDSDNSNNNRMVLASIKNLHVFLQGIMDVQHKIEHDYDNTPATFAAFDKDQIYYKLLDKASGCTSKCPCCDRPCDVDHSAIKSNP
ncbi:unnamed protein product, partial [Didymodactylos carnosus]